MKKSLYSMVIFHARSFAYHLAEADNASKLHPAKQRHQTKAMAAREHIISIATQTGHAPSSLFSHAMAYVRKNGQQA